MLAQALRHFGNDTSQALPVFDRVRVPYYHRMYAHLAEVAAKRAAKVQELGATDSEDERVKIKVIREGKDMSWIYQNHIGQVWEGVLAELRQEQAEQAKQAQQKEKEEGA